MTEDGTRPDRRAEQVSNDADSRPVTREAWERVAPDPDVETDLGYAIAEWEEVGTTDGSEARILLPADSEMIRDDSFIVADENAIVDLPSRR